MRLQTVFLTVLYKACVLLPQPHSKKWSGGVSIALVVGKNFLTRVTPYGIFI